VALAAVPDDVAAGSSDPDYEYSVCLHTHKCIQSTETGVLKLDFIAGDVNNKLKNQVRQNAGTLMMPSMLYAQQQALPGQPQ
jgi:hypothetical protein